MADKVADQTDATKPVTRLLSTPERTMHTRTSCSVPSNTMMNKVKVDSTVVTLGMGFPNHLIQSSGLQSAPVTEGPMLCVSARVGVLKTTPEHFVRRMTMWQDINAPGNPFDTPQALCCVLLDVYGSLHPDRGTDHNCREHADVGDHCNGRMSNVRLSVRSA